MLAEMLERRRVLWILFALAGIVAVWTAWIERQNWKMLETHAERELAAQARILADSLRPQLASVDAALQATAILRTQTPWDDEAAKRRLLAHMRALKTLAPLLREIVLFDQWGVLALDSGTLAPSPVSVADRDYFQRFAEAKEERAAATAFLGEPLQGRSSGEWFISASRPVADGDGAFLGVVLGVVDIAALAEALRRLPQRQTLAADVLVYSAQGRVVAAVMNETAMDEANRQRTGVPLDSLPAWAAVAPTPEPAPGLVADANALFAVQPVADYPLTVAISRPRRSIDDVWRQAFRRDMTMLAAAMLALGTVGWLSMRFAVDRERLFSLSPSPIGILDGKGRLLQVNASWVETLGSPQRESSQESLPDRLLPPENERLRQALRRLSQNQCSETLLCRIHDKTEQPLWLELSLFSTPRRIFCVARNQTARLNAETALADSEERYRGIVETVVDGIMSFDAQGRIQSVNPAAERLFGYAEDVMLGRDVFAFMPKETMPDHPLEHALGSGQAPRNPPNVAGRRSDGTTFPIELGLSVLTLRQGPLFLCVCRDVSEQKRIERLKDEFVSTVSHELRTPLTSIRGAVGLLAGGTAGELPEKAQRLLAIAHANCERLLGLINDILDLQRIEAGRIDFAMQPLDLAALARRAAEENAVYAAEHDATITVSAPPRAMILGDPQRLLQVMANLLSNAAKFSPSGGEIAVAVVPGDGVLRLSVADQGPGIPAEFRTRVFEKFSQADASDARSKAGTGLGLSIVRAIVERHGGSIDYASGEGKGTTFVIDLPPAAEA